MGTLGNGTTKVTWGHMKEWAQAHGVPDDAEVCEQDGIFLNDLATEQGMNEGEPTCFILTFCS